MANPDEFDWTKKPLTAVRVIVISTSLEVTDGIAGDLISAHLFQHAELLDTVDTVLTTSPDSAARTADAAVQAGYATWFAPGRDVSPEALDAMLAKLAPFRPKVHPTTSKTFAMYRLQAPEGEAAASESEAAVPEGEAAE